VQKTSVFLGFVPSTSCEFFYDEARFHLPFSLRGFWPPAARGDGARHAGHHLNTSSLPEVVGNAAVLVNPGERIRNLCEHTHRVLVDQILA